VRHKGLICNYSFKTDRQLSFCHNRIRQVRPKGTPGDVKCVTEILGGTKNIEIGGTKFKFGHVILRKIIKTVATRCHILRLKCTKFDFGWGSAPEPAGGVQKAPPDLLPGFKGVLLLTEGYGGGKGKVEGKRGTKEGG